ncbi:MAG: NAD(P)/FAD-dependent oxidoreductase [Tepidiformaceae bacterium]
MHDVAIAGGSLAGAATAIHLAAAGHSVVILERASFPRRKPCGEGLFPAGVRELCALGLGSLVTRGVALEAVRFIAGDACVTAGLADPGLGIERALLDGALLERAVAAGVDVRTGVTVRGFVSEGGRATGLVTSAGLVPARAVVAADGLHSRLRRQAGLERAGNGARFGVSAHVAFAYPLPARVDVHFGRGRELYVTPVAAGVANVALLTRRAGMRVFAGARRPAFESLLATHPRFAGGFELLDEPLAAGPFWRHCSRPSRANFLLVGDAAGFHDGISGEGMSAALLSARAAASALDSYLASGSFEPFRRYDARRLAITRNSNLLARLSLFLGRDPRLARLAIANLARQPHTFARLLAVNAGEAPLSSLRLRDALALATGL